MSFIYIYGKTNEFSTDPYLSSNSIIPSIIDDLEMSQTYYRTKIETFLQRLKGIHYAHKTPPFSRTLFSIGEENGEKASISKIDEFFNGESLQLIIPIQDYKSKKLERKINSNKQQYSGQKLKDYTHKEIELDYKIQTGEIEFNKGESGIEKEIRIHNARRETYKDSIYMPSEEFLKRLTI